MVGNGDEIVVLSPEEAAAYELDRQGAKEQNVRQSRSTMSLMPIAVTELSADNNGQFAECALGSGSLILLHPAEKREMIRFGLFTRHKAKLLCIRDVLLFDENGAAPILTIKNAECPL